MNGSHHHVLLNSQRGPRAIRARGVCLSSCEERGHLDGSFEVVCLVNLKT